MKININYFWTFWLLVFFLSSLQNCTCSKNRKIVDLTGIEVNLKIERFEKDLIKVDTSNIGNEVAGLKRKYPDFYTLFVEQIMRFRKTGDTTNLYLDQLASFISNEYIRGLNDSVQSRFEGFETEETKLTNAFRHYKYYFPDKHVPDVITFISEFGYGAITYDSTILGIGLDMYLGKQYPFYKSFFPAYIIEKLEQDKILPDCMKALYNGQFGGNENPASKLIYAMIEEGKEAYFTSMMLPEMDEHLLFGFSEEQFHWAAMSEHSIWQFMVDEDLIFSVNPDDKRKFLTEGPTTSGMPAEAPGNIGPWIGYQIIEHYVENPQNQHVSLRDLIETIDPEEIYKNSRYRPQ